MAGPVDDDWRAWALSSSPERAVSEVGTDLNCTRPLLLPVRRRLPSLLLRLPLLSLLPHPPPPNLM